MAITKLEAVNYSLVYAGEAPVSSLTGTDQGVDTSTALFLLDQVVSEWQERGLDENVYTAVLSPDPVTGEIALPANTLDVYLRDALFNLDTDSKFGGVVDAQLRDGKLWNNTNRTYNWLSPFDYTSDLEVSGFTITIKEELAWEELNQTSQRAIMVQTATRYQTVTQNDPATLQALARETQVTRARGRSNDIVNKNRGLFTHGDPNRQKSVSRRIGHVGFNDAYWTRVGYRDGYGGF